MNIKKIVALVAIVFVAFGLVACADTKSVKSIEVTGLTLPQDIKVEDSATINVDTVKVSVTYTDDTTGEVSLSDVQVRGDVTVSGDGKTLTLKTDKAGTMTIIISYSGVTTEIKYVVVAKILPDADQPSGSGTSEFPYLLSSVGNLLWLSKQVDGGETFSGKHFQLTADINMENLPWNPIGDVVQTINKGVRDATKVFSGVFDGNGHKITNLLINNKGIVSPGTAQSPLQGQALFAAIKDATIKNLTFENAVVNGLEGVAVVAAYATGTVVVDGVKVKGSTVTGGHWVGGILGYVTGDSLTIKNTVVEDSSIGASVYGKDANGDKVGGTVGHLAPTTVVAEKNTVKDVEVVAFRDMGGFAGYSTNEANVSISETVVQNVTLRLDKTQLTNPLFKDGEKGDNRYVAAIVGRVDGETILANLTANTFTNVTTFIRGEGKTEYTEYVTKEFGAKAQKGYTAK